MNNRNRVLMRYSIFTSKLRQSFISAFPAGRWERDSHRMPLTMKICVIFRLRLITGMAILYCPMSLLNTISFGSTVSIFKPQNFYRTATKKNRSYTRPVSGRSIGSSDRVRICEKPRIINFAESFTVSNPL